MNNNNLDQITMRSSKRKRSRIPQKFSNDTTIGIGEIQVMMCKKVLANSKSRFRVGNVVRLAPMVAPTFGQLKLHHNFAFVGMSDILSSDIYNAYLTQKPVAFGNGLVQVPKVLPCVSLRVLSAFALAGAKWTAYQVRDNHDDAAADSTLHRFYYNPVGPSDPYYVSGALSSPRWVGDSANSARNFLLHIGGLSPSGLSDQQISDALYKENQLWMKNANDIALFGEGSAFDGYSDYALNVGRVLGFTNDLWLPCSNAEMPLFFEPYNEETNPFIKQSSSYRPNLDNLEPVNFENYDFVIRTRLPYGDGSSLVSVDFAVKLSDFGVRWFKLLMSLGVGFDLQSDKPVDLSRFVACHLAWFNSFGITAYQGMETMRFRRLMASYESSYIWNYSYYVEELSPDSDGYPLADVVNLFGLFRELSDMWYTEEQDFVTSHSRQAVISADNGIVSEMNLSGVPNVNGKINVNTDSQSDQMFNGSDGLPTNTTAAGSFGHAFINNVLHSQLDSELLKRLYKVTNRNTIAGRRIAELLKAQGLGAYVKQCRSTFIGHSAVDIEIFDVTATADSSNEPDNVSSILGEYVGKGVGDGNSRWFSYESAEVGYIFDLAAVVPESGWSNGVDLTAFDVRAGQQYQPEYDALGLEISPKSVVTGLQDSFAVRDANAQPSVNEESYGFIPRFTRYKVARNVMNGGYALHSVRKSFRHYNLDKIVDVGTRVIRRNWVDDSSSKNYSSNAESKLLTAQNMPIASPVYRYLGRYPWMANFMRIFANIGRDINAQTPYYYDDFDSQIGDSEATWFTQRTDDQINVHNVYLCDYGAPVLPLEDSFETHEDGNNGVTDMAIGKS